MNSRPEAWVKQAHNDLALARLAEDNNFLAQACYLASQSAEKALKRFPQCRIAVFHPPPEIRDSDQDLPEEGSF